MSATELETRIRASLQDWADEIEDGAADAPSTDIAPDGPAPIRLVTLGPPTDPPRAPGVEARSTRWSPIRALVLAGAAALVLVVAVAVIRSPGADIQAVDGPVPTAPEPAPGPRAVATVLPDGYRPIWRSETAPEDLARVIGGGAYTVQRFDIAGGSVTVVIRPEIGAVMQGNPSDRRVHEQPATVTSGSGLTRVSWNEAGAMVEVVSDGPDEATTLALLESLVLRTSDAADGFDAPEGDTSGATLRAEHVWPPGSTSPATSTVAYAATGSSRWSFVVSSFAPAGGADLALVTSDAGSDRQVIAGQERVVVTPERQRQRQLMSFPDSDPGLADLFHVVAWYDTDGSLIVVSARDVDDQTIDAVVAGVDRGDDATWAAVSTGISAQVGSLPVATTSSFGDVELTMRGEAPEPGDVPGEWSPAGACIRPVGGSTLCNSDPSGGQGGAPMMLASTGWVSTLTGSEVGWHLVTVATADGWWLFGAVDGTNDDIRISADGEDVAQQWVAPLDGSGVGVAAFIPGSASRATVTMSYLSTPSGTEVPATGVPQRQTSEFTIDAPAR